MQRSVYLLCCLSLLTHATYVRPEAGVGGKGRQCYQQYEWNQVRTGDELQQDGWKEGRPHAALLHTDHLVL